jgi:hypothetical protein
VTGSAIGAGTGQAAAQGVQRPFDAAYEQCMHVKGNQIPTAVAPPPPAP